MTDPTLIKVDMQIGMSNGGVSLGIRDAVAMSVDIESARIECDMQRESVVKYFDELEPLLNDENLFNAAAVTRLLAAFRDHVLAHQPTYHMVNEFLRCFHVGGRDCANTYSMALSQSLQQDSESGGAAPGIAMPELTKGFDTDTFNVNDDNDGNEDGMIRRCKSISHAVRSGDAICIHCWIGESVHRCHDCGEPDHKRSTINHSNCMSAGMETPSNERKH